MKSVFILLICSFSVSFALQAQTSKWFFTATTGLSLGGPGPSIKNNMERNGFSDGSSGPNFIIGTSFDYPHVFHGLPLLVMFGKQISKYGSVYLIFGESTKGEVRGFNSTSGISIKYNVLQFTPGYQFSFPKTKFKIGAGPSVFVFKYAKNHPKEDEHTVVVPGVTVNGRLPFGKEKKLFGIELFFETNLAPPVNVKEFQTNMSTLKASKANMVHGVLGLSFALRR